MSKMGSLGARFGHEGIPEDWLRALLNRYELEKTDGWIQNFEMILDSD